MESEKITFINSFYLEIMKKGIKNQIRIIDKRKQKTVTKITKSSFNNVF